MILLLRRRWNKTGRPFYLFWLKIRAAGQTLLPQKKSGKASGIKRLRICVRCPWGRKKCAFYSQRLLRLKWIVCGGYRLLNLHLRLNNWSAPPHFSGAEIHRLTSFLSSVLLQPVTSNIQQAKLTGEILMMRKCWGNFIDSSSLSQVLIVHIKLKLHNSHLVMI